jgi:acyl-CoA thioesterase-1
MRAALFFPVLALLALPAIVAAAGDVPTGCATPPALGAPERPLPVLRAALAGDGPIEILAVGSASTVGLETGGHGASYVARMAETLRAALPGRALNVTVRGDRGMTATAMAALIAAELPSHAYRLVIWQTGTVEAVKGLPPEELRRALAAGAARVREAGASLVLIDPQFTATLRDKTNLASYRRIMEQAVMDQGGGPDAALFHRFDLTQDWARAQNLDLERVAKTERETVLQTLRACVGDALAGFVLATADIGGMGLTRGGKQGKQ